MTEVVDFFQSTALYGIGWSASLTSMFIIGNLFLREKINPLIGSAGISAVPMAARNSRQIAPEAKPRAFILPHARGPNVAGVMGSTVVAVVFISMVQ